MESLAHNAIELLYDYLQQLHNISTNDPLVPVLGFTFVVFFLLWIFGIFNLASTCLYIVQGFLFVFGLIVEAFRLLLQHVAILVGIVGVGLAAYCVKEFLIDKK